MTNEELKDWLSVNNTKLDILIQQTQSISHRIESLEKFRTAFFKVLAYSFTSTIAIFAIIAIWPK